jgi:hypothetical protein
MSQPPNDREHLEAVWWERVQTCRQRYEAAKLASVGAMNECHCETSTAEKELALNQAHRAESAALEEYMRVLRIFHDLVVDRKRPD